MIDSDESRGHGANAAGDEHLRRRAGCLVVVVVVVVVARRPPDEASASASGRWRGCFLVHVDVDVALLPYCTRHSIRHTRGLLSPSGRRKRRGRDAREDVVGGDHGGGEFGK